MVSRKRLIVTGKKAGERGGTPKDKGGYGGLEGAAIARFSQWPGVAHARCLVRSGRHRIARHLAAVLEWQRPGNSLEIGFQAKASAREIYIKYTIFSFISEPFQSVTK